jgi:HSP20 family protein
MKIRQRLISSRPISLQNAGHVGKTKQQLQLLTWIELTRGVIPTSSYRQERRSKKNKAETSSSPSFAGRVQEINGPTMGPFFFSGLFALVAPAARTRPDSQRPSQEKPMATDKQSTGREQARQQTSEMAHGAAQQGSNPSQGAGSQSTAWQDPSTGGQGQSPSRGTMEPRRGSSLPSAYGFGGGPFSMLRRFNEDMERLFESFGFGRSLFPADAGQGMWPASGGESSSLWSPRVEVFERDGKLVISADLPGVKKEDVNVQIDRDGVTIQGERKQENTTNERGYYRSERSYGSFYRTIPLPEGADAQSASATFRDGVLQIEIKAPQQRSTARTLEIEDASSTGTTSRSSTGESQQAARGDKQQR